MKNVFKLDKNQLIAAVIFFWLGLVFLAILLTLTGFFYKSILALYLILGAAFVAYLFIKNKPNFRFDLILFAVILSSLLVITAFSLFSTPSIFSGRDQGSFSEAAIRLSQNHKLTFSFPAQEEFFKIYGPGRALNFPGFNYTQDGQLQTQFPIGYISWLAVFYSLFGLVGFSIANGITIFIFFISFYLLCRTFFSSKQALIPFLFALTCFAFSWFPKLTLSENLAIALIWIGLFWFVRYLKDKNNLELTIAFFSFYLLLFTRIEAIAFLAMIGVILYFKKDDFYKKISQKTYYIFAGLSGIYIASLYINREFYISFAKGFLNSTADYANINLFSDTLPAMQVFRIFNLYGLLVFLMMGMAGIIFLGIKRKSAHLVPFFVLLPSFIYLIYPSITLDHPWMLRRYVFSILPLLIFYCASFLFHIFEKRMKWVYFFSSLVILSNIVVSIFYFTGAENKNLLPQVRNISQNFLNSDLILVDQQASGSGWAMMTGPMDFLYGKQAVYFFNPKDLEKINKENFSNIYLIAPDWNIDFYKNSSLANKLSLVKKYQISNNSFSSSDITNTSSLPFINNNSTNGEIYLLENTK